MCTASRQRAPSSNRAYRASLDQLARDEDPVDQRCARFFDQLNELFGCGAAWLHRRRPTGRRGLRVQIHNKGRPQGRRAVFLARRQTCTADNRPARDVRRRCGAASRGCSLPPVVNSDADGYLYKNHAASRRKSPKIAPYDIISKFTLAGLSKKGLKSKLCKAST